MNGIEHRAATRFRLLGFSTIPCEISHGQKKWSGRVVNASEFGFGLEVDARPDEFSRHEQISLGFQWENKGASREILVGGKVTHIDPASVQGARLRLGIQVTSAHQGFSQEMAQFCQQLADSGRATGLTLHKTGAGRVVQLHGALSLKTIADTVSLIATNSGVTHIDFSDCNTDGQLGGRLGQVAISFGIKMSGCRPELALLMHKALVCQSCRACHTH
jgi:hypothetical protein